LIASHCDVDLHPWHEVHGVFGTANTDATSSSRTSSSVKGLTIATLYFMDVTPLGQAPVHAQWIGRPQRDAIKRRANRSDSNGSDWSKDFYGSDFSVCMAAYLNNIKLD
jgi:hypothetical protein